MIVYVSTKPFKSNNGGNNISEFVRIYGDVTVLEC